MHPAFRYGIMFLGLFALWLVMSGIYKPLIVAFGVISCLLSIWITQRLGLLDSHRTIFNFLRPIALIKYLFWLTVEIGKADWAVTRVILGPGKSIRQRLIRVPANQKTDLGKALFANSITITPGTVTVETEEESFIVHALTDEAADTEGLMTMSNAVCHVEQPELA